ncbi:MAG: hypothetical protein L3J70_03765 [Gammaproteobacteria bacterium]|nr:hypothetical protein [Gammaproteobacteria bacterium]
MNTILLGIFKLTGIGGLLLIIMVLCIVGVINRTEGKNSKGGGWDDGCGG